MPLTSDQKAQSGYLGGAAINSTTQQAQDCAKEYRPTMRDRISRRLEEIEMVSSKTNRLLELQHLLDKNPEVARILELLDIHVNI